MRSIFQTALAFFVSVTLLLSFVVTAFAANEGLMKREPLVSVCFINVGKADAALLMVDGQAWMVDVGHKNSAPQLIAALRALSVDRLDGVFLTHGHGDHVGGIDAVALAVPIGALFGAGLPRAMDDGEGRIEEAAQRLSLPLYDLFAGHEMRLSEEVFLEVIAPIVFNAVDENDNSLVLRLTAGKTVFLFTGDMQFAEEETLLKSGVDLKADVLKVGNHGNPDATGMAFAHAVSPALSVISTDTSVDTNSANPRVIDSLSGSRILVTQDDDLGILVSTDGETLSVGTLERPGRELQVSISSADLGSQTVTLQNEGPEAELSGCFLYSTKGSEVFIFPEGSVLGVGQSVTVASKGLKGDYIWPVKNVWSKKGGDTAMLYDRYGNLLDHMESR